MWEVQTVPGVGDGRAKVGPTATVVGASATGNDWVAILAGTSGDRARRRAPLTKGTNIPVPVPVYSGFCEDRHGRRRGQFSETLTWKAEPCAALKGWITT
jgi:hypothetical protein